MSAPLIGVTTFRSLNQYGLPQVGISEAYTKALMNAGACPVLIPLGLPTERLEDLISRLDGILFTGGGDIHPQHYGSQMHPLVDDIDAERDEIEINLVQKITKTELPFMGICRGLQVLNVALGGSLYKDILDQRPEARKHQYYPNWPRNYLAHAVRIESTSQLGRILGLENVEVNSLHHQGIRNLAPGLQATAFAPDGLVEAFEVPGRPFALAVQWHPEWLQEHVPMQTLFRAFVQAAEKQPAR